MRGSRIGELVRGLALGYTRDRTALFFSLIFPLIFLLVLGGIFGNDSQTPRVDVFVVGDGPLISKLSTDSLDIERVSSVEDGLEQVREGDRPALIYERGRTLVVRYAASDQVGGATVRGIVEGVVNQANLEAAGTEPRYALEASRVEDDSLSPIEFFTPALLAYAISIGAVFGAALTLVTWREKGLLRRLRLAPLRPSEIATGRVMVSLAIALVQLLLFLGAGVLLFDLSLDASWWMAFPLILVGTLAFLAIGLITGAVTNTAEGASAVANLITLPMAFLSGAFFPIDLAPGWLQAVSKALPLTYLVEGLQDAMVRGLSAAAALPELGVLAAFALGLGVLGIRLFRWETV
jgi:ABC-2 type transport system permease protein